MENNISRRQFVAALTAVMGTALTPLSVKALAFAPHFGGNKKLNILTTNQLKLVKTIVNIIIPETKTPGAEEAGVHLFIDHMLANFMNDVESKAVIISIDDFNLKNAQFLSLSSKKQLQIVTELDSTMKENDAYRSFKQLTVMGYYTSEIGASQELSFDYVPGPYREIPLKDVDRAWY